MSKGDLILKSNLIRPRRFSAPELQERTSRQPSDEASETDDITSCNYFKYAPIDLQGKNIRVFRINYEKNGIHLSLDHAEFTGQQTAVSYVWGPDTPTHEISINGRRFSVRQNLYSFLCAMKNTRRNDLFWVDAICINQENDREKNHQVRQMHRMYSQAAEVCLWIGSASLETAALFRALKSGVAPNDSDCSFCKGDDHSLDCYSRIIKEILDDRYWTRTWIVQEILLSRGRSMLTLGSDGVSLKKLRAILQRAINSDMFSTVPKTRGWKFINMGDMIQSAEGGHSAERLVQTDDWWFFRVLGLLRDFGDCQCSDLRDRIYVMLVITGGEGTKIIDYSLSTAELYAKMLDVWISGEPLQHETSSLEALSAVERLLRQVLELSHSTARHALTVLQDQRPEWAFAMKLESIREVTLTGGLPSLCHVLSDVGPLESRRAIEACSCTTCRAFPLPLNKTLLFFSVGQASSKAGRGPYFINIKGERSFCALAYGSLEEAASPLRIIRSVNLNYIDATSITRLSEDIFQPAPHRHYDMYLDMKVSPPDLLDFLLTNRKDRDYNSILRQMPPECYKAFWPD